MKRWDAHFFALKRGCMGKLKLYYFSDETLRFVEARWAKTKFALVTLCLGVLAVVGGVEVNQYFGDILGLNFGRARVLATENAMLKQQLRTLVGRLQGLEQELVKLNEEGNELRMLVDLPKIDEDTRKAGVGGTDERIDFGGPGDVNALLRDLHRMAGKAERELQLQSRSYGDIVKTFEENKVRFAHMPAIKPMEGYYSAQGFGMRLHPVLRIFKTHEGIDIVNDAGTPVYATGDGVVEYAGRTGGGYGIMLEINHGYGYNTLYAHLESVLVKEGQRVKRGDLIARSGRTGLVSGPHLHYEVRLNGIRVNPIDYFFDDVNYQEYKNQVVILD